jgi:hypothetical protein
MFASRLVLPLIIAAAGFAAVPALGQASTSRPAAPLLSATDGRWLFNACASNQAANRSFCFGYVIGIADHLAMDRLVCRPAGAGGEQLVGLVRSHLAASPNDLARHAAFLVRRVLLATYPCRR